MNLDLTTALASAGWPVLLVNNGATLLSANASAQNFFGANVSVGQPQLDAFWPAENGCAAADFFVLWTSMPTTSTELKFRGANGAIKTFFTVINALTSHGENHFLLQLFAPETGPLPATKIIVPPKPAPVVVAASAPTVVPSDAVLKQKLDCVLQLARTVSLDLNNALTGVLAHASWLLDRADADHPWRHSLVEVEKSSLRAAEISAELAAYSRKEKEPRQTPPGNLNLIVSRCAEFFRNAHDQVFDWRLKQEPALNGARFDEAKLQQALTKVFENAVESFVGQRGGMISIETQNVELTGQAQDRNVTLAAGNYVCVGISDTGTGMAEDVATRAFEPFFTTKSPPHRGLGLALVYGIVTNHGGGGSNF